MLPCRCGGVIIHSSIGRARVNGRLEMTRSLGDVDLKRFGVIAEPEIRHMKVGILLINLSDNSRLVHKKEMWHAYVTFTVI